MKNILLAFLLIAIAPAVAAAAGPHFIVCKSTYALCTTAPCKPIPGRKKVVSCQCDVETGYSAGMKTCEEKKTGEGLKLRSRYYPITSYARCTNGRPWAACLDVPCTVEKNDPSHALCRCEVAAAQGPYVIVNADGKYNDSSCTTGMYSSATVVQVDEVTAFLKSHATPLRPSPIKVFTGK
jgi:hypothetical protein